MHAPAPFTAGSKRVLLFRQVKGDRSQILTVGFQDHTAARQVLRKFFLQK